MVSLFDFLQKKKKKKKPFKISQINYKNKIKKKKIIFFFL